LRASRRDHGNEAEAGAYSWVVVTDVELKISTRPSTPERGEWANG
jgi:hypothetical protein